MCGGDLYKQQQKKSNEIHVPKSLDDINAQMPEAFHLQPPDPEMMKRSKEASVKYVKEKDYVSEKLKKMEKADEEKQNERKIHGQHLNGQIQDALQNAGPVHAVRFLPGSMTLTREYLGQLRADLGDQQRLSKKNNVKSRLYRKDQNSVALKTAQEQREARSNQQIQALKNRFPDFDEETIKSLTYFAVNGNSIPAILDELTVYLFKINIGDLHMEDDEDIVANAAKLEKLSCQMKAYDKLLEKNPKFLDSISADVRKKIEKKLTQLHTIAFYYDARKAVMTDQYFIDHYNEELSLDVDANSPKAQRKLAEKLVNTYILGRRLLRVNGVGAMDMLSYGFILPKNEYVTKLMTRAKKKYCQDENTGKYAASSLSDAIRNLRASGSFWGDSNEMKQVKEEVDAVERLLNAGTKGRLLEEVKIPIIDTLGRLERTCNMYVEKKVKDVRKDTSRRHLSVINIMEAAKMARRFWEPLTQEKYNRLKPEVENKTAADLMRDSGQQIERNALEEEKTRRQVERKRHVEAENYTLSLHSAGSSFDYAYDHREILKKLRDKIPVKVREFEIDKSTIEKKYTDLISQCDKYLKKNHDFNRMIKVRELRQTYITERNRIRALDYYEINKAHAHESWEKLLIGGAVYVEKKGKGYVTDDGREKITVITSQTSIKDNSFIKAAKTLGFESGMFKNYEEALVKKEDGTYQKSVISTLDEVNKKWTTFGDIVWAAQNFKSNMVYSDTALRQLSSIQILDELLGIRNRSLNSLKYLGRIEIVIGEPTLIIDAVRIEAPISVSSDAELKDGEKGSIYDEKGKLRLPAYDRTMADKILSMEPEEFVTNLQSQGIELTAQEKDGFIKRYNKLKTALLLDKTDDNGWRKKHEEEEKKAAARIVAASVKQIEKYVSAGIGPDNGMFMREKKKMIHYNNHPYLALENQFVKSFDQAMTTKQYTGYARKEILTENLGDEKAFADLTKKELGREAYNTYTRSLGNVEKQIKDIEEYKAKFKPESEKKRLSIKKQLQDDLTEDLKLQGMDNKYYDALKAFMSYATMNVTGQDAYEMVEFEKNGKKYGKLKKTEKKTHEEATALLNADKLLKERLDLLPENEVSKEKEVLEKYIKRIDEITSGRLTVPKQGPNVITVTDDKFVDLENVKLDKWEENKKDYEWKQVDEPLFSHEPCVNDVVQGTVGNCYMLAALGSLVEKNPSFIRNMMKENKKDNTVTVRFVNGKQKIYVTVSKTVPVQKGNKTVSRFASGALWVQMIEKAFVASGLISVVKELNSGLSNDEKMLIQEAEEKGIKSYENIDAGLSDKFMKIITGNTCDNVDFITRRSDNDLQYGVGTFTQGNPETNFLNLAKKLNDENSHQILTVGSRHDFELEEGVGLNGEKMMRGIASKHAYTVLGYDTVGGVPMILLRNPWGYGTVEAKINKVTGAISIRKASAEYAAGAFMIPLDTFFFMFDHYSVMSVKSFMNEEKGRLNPKKKSGN